MKRFLATTAIMALAAAPVMADSHSANESGANTSTSAEMSQGHTDSAAKTDVSAKIGDMNVRASDMIGQDVYIRNADAPDQEIADSVSEPADDWERVGEIGDIILNKDGKIDAVTLDAGGFLGIGEKHVKTSMDELKFVASDNGDNAEAEAEAQQEFFVVFTGDRSALEDRDEIDEQSLRDSGNSFWGDTSDEQRPNENSEARATTEDTGNTTGEHDSTNASEQGTHSAADNAEMTGGQAGELTDDQRGALTAEDLQGLSVYGTDGESIGEISELVVNDSGEISKTVIDVGGFLGLGEKSVALPFEEITLHEGGEEMTDRLRATTSYSSEELEGMQEWEG
ncbi:PRC-barrel domain protein [Roseovarius sp. A-2]|uniref:PRC-barrel domain-containing protein n=1 Tax=Roseovarius sp. A-2 TaxID=1570360 RepID=UPI0009D1A904|nr:PRC-barrel domain-containing protein [Roseovarius sp. A-2]GAW35138.1 PRC-barrel domain protein [Roseovarius sp. A-2]